MGVDCYKNCSNFRTVVDSVAKTGSEPTRMRLQTLVQTILGMA